MYQNRNQPQKLGLVFFYKKEYFVNKFLNLVCGMKSKSRKTHGFNSPDWQETRYDIDTSVNPKIDGSMIDMHKVKDRSFDAIY